MLQFLQRIGKALMLPIAVLPAAGLLLRLGQEDVFNIPVMAQAGAAIFDNLALILQLVLQSVCLLTVVEQLDLPEQSDILFYKIQRML